MTDKVGALASRTYAITIATAASSILTITTQSLPGTEAGVTYAQTLTASGGRVPYRWYHRGGTLPTGVNLDRGSGQISGVPQDQGTFRLTVEVEDAAETAATADLSITVGASQLRIVTPRLFDETLGKRMEAFTLKATGGKEPLEWQATGLPDGLQLSTTGVLTGTPTKVGMFAGIQVTVRDADRKTASQTYSMRIRDAVLAITTESLPKAYKGRVYRADILTAFAQGPVRYSVAGTTPFAPPPKLPGGLSLGSATGVIDGTATETGSFPFNVLAVDSGRSDSKAFTLVVEEPPPALTITLSDAVPATVVGEVLTLSALGKGGDRSRYEYSFADPKPVGMSIDPRSGVVSVSAVRPGVINGIVRLTDGDQTVTIPLGVNVYEPLSGELLPPCGNATTSKLRAADNNCSPDAAPSFAAAGQPLTWVVSFTGGVPGQQRNLGLSLVSNTASGEVKVSGVSTSGSTPGIIRFNKSMPAGIGSIRPDGLTELIGDVLQPPESGPVPRSASVEFNSGGTWGTTYSLSSRHFSSLFPPYDPQPGPDPNVLRRGKCEAPPADCGLLFDLTFQSLFPQDFKPGTKLKAHIDLSPGVRIAVSGGTWDQSTNTWTYTVSEPTSRVVAPVTITPPEGGQCPRVCMTVSTATDDSPLRLVGAALGGPLLFPFIPTLPVYDTGVPISNAIAPGSGITFKSSKLNKSSFTIDHLAQPGTKVDLISNSGISNHTMRGTNESSSEPVTYTIPYQFVPDPSDPLAVIEEGEPTEPVFGPSRRRAAESTEPKAQAAVVLKNVAPFLFSADLSGKGPADAHVIRILADGTEKVEPAARWDAQLNKSFTIPVTLGNDPVPLILLATGIHNYSHLRNAHVRFGHVFAPVSLIAERTLGLEEIRVVIPESLKNSGEVEVQLVIDGEVSNILTLDIR